jgi:hypothetical protein
MWERRAPKDAHPRGSLNLSTFILTINFGFSPPDLSIFTKPVLPAPLINPLGSTLCLLKGRSSPPLISFLFLLLLFLSWASFSEGNLSLTILLLLVGFDWLCLGGTGTGRGAGVEVPDLGGGGGAALGRGGGTLGRDGAGVDGREFGAEDPGTVLVLILILGPDEGIGECIGDGAEMTFGMLTGAGFGRGAAAAGVAAVGFGEGIGVFAIDAGVGSLFGGDNAGGLAGFGGSRGGSCLTTAGCGAGDAFREGGADIGAGEACFIGGENVGCDLANAEGGGEDALPDFGLPNLSDSFGFGGAATLGAVTWGGTTGAGGGCTGIARESSTGA